MDLGLTGKRALVAASSKGLGRGIAEHLAREGCAVAINGRTEETLERAASELRAAGAEVAAVSADVSTAEGCERLVERARAALGGIDILVTNTGGPPPGTFFECDDDQWAESFHSTLMNVVRLVRLAAPEMRDRGWGRILHVASASAKQPVDGLTLSNAFRPAIAGVSKDLSLELAPHGVTVNTLCPGAHLTDRLRALHEDEDSFIERMRSSIPVGQVGDTDQFGAVAAFLASEHAWFITGSTIAIEGGAIRAIH